MTRYRVVIRKEDIPEPLVLKADTQALHLQRKEVIQGPHRLKVDILEPSQQLRLKFSNGLML